ncbi:MAG: hypothetical protein HYU81_01685 [Candidatus Brennerbacteria bacterium]|nr:hypothetical protein [Candidatus Brennerbacteria bacterium]
MEGSTFSQKIGAGEGESPLGAPRPQVEPRPIPPPPSLETRTFASDLDSIRTSGGSEPTPYTPAATTPPKPAAIPIAEAAPLGAHLPVPPASADPSFSSPTLPPSATGGGKRVFVAILSFLIVIGLGAVGYFFIYPLFTAEEEAPVTVTPTPSAPALPEEIFSDEVAEVPALEAPAADPWSGVLTLSSHRSIFQIIPDTTTELILAEPALAAVKSSVPSGAVATPLLSETVFKTPSGGFVPLSVIASLIAPTFFTPERLAAFNDDAAYYTYAAPNGTWFGVAMPLKADVPIGPVQDGMSALQADPNLLNFFLENPGEKGVWADGRVRGKPASQVSFSAPDAVFSYVWMGRTLLLSTNLTGAEEAARRLGF